MKFIILGLFLVLQELGVQPYYKKRNKEREMRKKVKRNLKSEVWFGVDGSCLSFYCKLCGSRKVDIEGNSNITKGEVRVYCWNCHKYSIWEKE